MLKRACICTAILSLLVILGLPIAQARTVELISVHVPFDFVLGDRVLPAGHYYVRQLTENSPAIIIRDADKGEALMVLTNSTDAKGQQPKAPRLVFRRYGDQYFLASVWINTEAGRALGESRRERSLRKELAQAGHASAPEVVAVVASN